MSIRFDYFYGNESEQFSFYRIPKVIITSPEFINLSYGTKLLYGMLLDRMSLSIKNRWFDSNGRAYIIFSIKTIIESFNCSKGTAVKMLSELKKAGLIERKKRGQGLADYIYVKKFFAPEEKAVQNLNNKKSESYNSDISKDELQEMNFKRFKIQNVHKDYIKEHHRSLYSKMLIDGTLLDYLENIDNTARNEVERLVAAISEKEGVNEKLKTENQMKWVVLKNSIKHSAEEIVNNNIIYSINFAFVFGKIIEK